MSVDPSRVAVVWDESLLGYKLSDSHPLNPVRLDLTMRLARGLGVLDGVDLHAPVAAPDEELRRVHVASYLDAVRAAPEGGDDPVHQLGTTDNPIFEGMHEASALATGASIVAAREIAEGRADRAVNIAGGLHHAMADHAWGFCVYNDCAVAISWLLDHGYSRIAYLDTDVHHGDGVQAAFADDPRVLTVSMHQHPRTLWPGTGFPSELGDGEASGTAVNLALPPGTRDPAWLRAFHAVVPSLLASFRPQILVTQNGADTHHEDPLAELSLSVDGHRAIYRACRELADEHAGGKWLALGGGGYGLFRAVPRSWTHLLATVLDRDVDPLRPVPADWTAYASTLSRRPLPTSMTEDAPTDFERWGGVTETDVDPFLLETRRAVFPLHGLDPANPPRLMGGSMVEGDAETVPLSSVEDADYPAHWEADVVASDGATVHLRPITAADAEDVVAFHGRLSERTRYFRYFSPYPTIPERDLRRFVEVDHRDSVALVVTLGEEIIAVGRYVRLSGTESAEVAFVVRDDHQGRGLGSILLEHLAAAARERGLSRFVAEVLTENRAMTRVFRDAGYEVSRALEGTTLHLEFDVASTPRSREVQLAREQAAEARSVEGVLRPRSVAVVGASLDESKIGHVVLANLLAGDFTGPVFPVHPEARSVRGVRAYGDVREIPDDVDLAVLAVPPDEVEGVAQACLSKGVRGLVVISSGFGETGPRGLAAQRDLVGEARAHGMRVIGPSALGVVNLDRTVSLNASLAPVLPPPGRVGFFCQSGALGIQILDTAHRRNLGLSTFVSAGNRADVSGNDLMQYWDTDPQTDVVLLYLETFGNPRKFARVARRLARRKPVVAVKSGRHVGATPGLAASASPVDEAAVEAVFDQSGVIRVDSVDELFDVALLLAHQPMPAGPRVGIVGNSSALGLIAADVALAQGLYVPRRAVDVGSAAGPEDLARAVSEVLAADDCDALVVVFVPPVATDGTEHARALAAAVRDVEKPVLTTFLATDGVPATLAVTGDDPSVPLRGSVPSYPSPERAVLALARVVRYTQWRSRPVGEFVVPPGVDVDAARALVEELAPQPGTVLDDEQADALLRCAGVVVAPFRRVRTADEAVAAARDVGGGVVLKTAERRWRHRSDLRGVHVGLTDEQGIRAAYAQLVSLSGAAEVYVQAQAPPGLPCVVEVRDDPSFGSLISFGLAGVVTELLGDRAYRATPLSTMDAATLVRAPRAAPLLDGYRGAKPVDLAALEDLLLRIGVLADRVPEIRSLVLDPVLAADRGAHPTGMTIVLGPPPGPRDSGPRRMS